MKARAWCFFPCLSFHDFSFPHSPLPLEKQWSLSAPVPPLCVLDIRSRCNAILWTAMAGVESEGSEGDKILRDAVRQNLDKWLQKLDCSGDVEKKLALKMKFVEKLRKSPVAVETARANQQHYEVPTNFFRTVSFFVFLSFSSSLGVLRGCHLCTREEVKKSTKC